MLLCVEMSGVTAGQRLGQWQPTLGARECVSKCGSGQSWGNKGFIKAPLIVWSAYVLGNQTVFFSSLNWCRGRNAIGLFLFLTDFPR